MEPDQFVLAASYGDEATAREALAGNPALAATRSEAGISVIAAAVYAGRLEFARELAALRDDLDLFEASCIGHRSRVLTLLAEDPKSIDRFAPDGFSPIGFAAYFGHLDLLRLLIDHGAALEEPARNPMRVRPLHSAAAHSDPNHATTLCRCLLEAGADPNAQQEGGYAPLHEAVLNGNGNLIELLLAFGANPHLSNDDGDSPLQIAQARGDDKTAALILTRI